MFALGGLAVIILGFAMCLGRGFGIRDAIELAHGVGVTKEAVVPDHTGEHSTQSQHTQRDQHDHRAFMRVIVRMLVAARLAVEGQEDQAPGVEGGHRRCDHQHPEAVHGTTCIGAFDDGIFRQEACKADVRQRNTNAGDGKGTDHHRPEGIGDFLAQTAVVHHVLLVVHRVDHGPCTKEQHRFEKGVREQVEHRCGVHADPGCNEHVAKLRTGRIGDHTFDVGLDQTNRRRKERRGRTQDGDKGGRFRRHFHQGRHAAHKEHTSSNHRRCVDQGRNWGRAFHRVRQPGVQDQLSRFTHRTDEQQEGNQVCRVPFRPQETQLGFSQHRRRGKDVIKVDAASQEEQRKDTKRKAEVTDAVDDERFHRGRTSRGFTVVKADQQVGGNAHTFPAKEHLDQVVGGHQHQHGEGKERQVGKEPRLVALPVLPLRIVIHVAKGVEVNQRGHGRDHDQHDRGQTVNAELPGRVEATGLDPAQDFDGVIAVFMRRGVKRQEDDPGQRRRQEEKCSGEHGRHFFAKDLVAKATDQRPHQRGKEKDGFHDALALHHVDVFNGNGAAVTEEANQDRKTDGGLSSGHCQNKQSEDLPDQIAKERREGHEVDVHREEHQFDAHQQDDDVLAVQKEPEDADDEQRRRDG